ncbi:hypothetical protein ACWC0C_43420 [Streptomyces sp. NPDC001709]
MSKIVRAAVIAVLIATPAFGAAANASTTALGAGIRWEQAPTAVAAAGAVGASAVTPPQTDGIGWN